jgi:hypothetical protein
MRRYGTFGLLTASAASLAITMLGAGPSAQAGVVSPHKAPPVGRRLAVLKGSGTGFNDRFGSEVAISGTIAVVGESQAAEGLATTWVWVFTRTRSGWKQVAKLTGSGTSAQTANDDFGGSIAISGTTVVVGAPEFGGAVTDGRVYVFAQTKSGWKQTSALAESDPSADGGDEFGSSVAISGDTIIAGAPDHDYGTGASTQFGGAYIFARHGAGWKQVAEFTGTGNSVAISGARAVAGSIGAAVGAGRAYVYDRTAAGAWKRAATLKGSDTTNNGSAAAGDHFGASVAISGTTIAVGAPQHADLRGRVYVFAQTKSGWKQTAELKGGGGFYLGSQVAISGSTLLANDTLVDSPVFVYAASRAGWRRIAGLDPPGGPPAEPGDPGAPVAISGALALVGSPPAGGNYSGRAYVYEA